MNSTGLALSFGIIATVFVCVVLHEYGHALTARRFGVETRDIILTPIGGIARLEYIPEKPLQEILIAIAGPAVNLVIALLLLIYAKLFTPYWIDLKSPFFWMMNYAQPVLVIILKINLILLAFNLIPAFPMDGGRVLRAALSLTVDRVKATRYAALIGQAVGIGLFAAALIELIFQRSVFIAGVKVSDLILGIIGVFIFTAARREVKAVEFKAALRSYTVEDLMSTAPELIPPYVPISVLDGALTKDTGVLIGVDGKLTGIIFKEHLDEAVQLGLSELNVGNVASDSYEVLDKRTDISTVIDIFRENGYRLCPVFENGTLIGTLTRSQLVSFIAEHEN